MGHPPSSTGVAPVVQYIKPILSSAPSSIPSSHPLDELSDLYINMTRTERASFPRAIIKDRAESKTGMDKRTPKQGAGTHNWGSLIDERELEEGAEYDEVRELEETGRT